MSQGHQFILHHDDWNKGRAEIEVFFDDFENDPVHADHLPIDPALSPPAHGTGNELTHAATAPMYTQSVETGYDPAFDMAPASHGYGMLDEYPSTAPRSVPAAPMSLGYALVTGPTPLSRGRHDICEEPHMLQQPYFTPPVYNSNGQPVGSVLLSEGSRNDSECLQRALHHVDTSKMPGRSAPDELRVDPVLHPHEQSNTNMTSQLALDSAPDLSSDWGFWEHHIPIATPPSASPQQGHVFDASAHRLRRSQSSFTLSRDGSHRPSTRQAKAIPWPKENPICLKCEENAKDPKKPPRRFKPTEYNQGILCNKHTKQRLKDEEGERAPVYTFDDSPDAGCGERTIDMVYPILPPLAWDRDNSMDDFQDHIDKESLWTLRFIEAANTEYVRPDESIESQDAADVADRQRKHENALKQQHIYNKKPLEASSCEFYTRDWVNARMRLLFREVLTFHRGGKTLYPSGGNNNGYGQDKKLKFTERLNVIINAMKVDKRVVMDVIEGRGVAALAMNPKRFADRKNSNNKCNENKKRKLDLVDGMLEDNDGDGDNESPRDSSATPGPSRRSRRKG